MTAMKKFLAVYMGSAAALAEWNALDEATRKAREKAGIAAWKKWAADHGGAIVELGSPIGKTKRVSAEGIADMKNEIGAYTVVQAESHDAAARLFESHPHFAIFPGDRVEVMECLPLPEM
jgi:hypothetical protein